MEPTNLKLAGEETLEINGLVDHSRLGLIPVMDFARFIRKACGARVNRRNVNWVEYAAKLPAAERHMEDRNQQNSEKVGEAFHTGNRGGALYEQYLMASLNIRHVALVVEPRKREMVLDCWRFRDRMFEFLMGSPRSKGNGDLLGEIRDIPTAVTLEGGTIHKVSDGDGQHVGVIVREPGHVRVEKARITFGLVGWKSFVRGEAVDAGSRYSYANPTKPALAILAMDRDGLVLGYVSFAVEWFGDNRHKVYVDSNLSSHIDAQAREMYLAPAFETESWFAAKRIVHTHEILRLPGVSEYVQRFFRRLPVVAQAWEALKLRHARLLLKYADI